MIKSIKFIIIIYNISLLIHRTHKNNQNHMRGRVTPLTPWLFSLVTAVCKIYCKFIANKDRWWITHENYFLTTECRKCFRLVNNLFIQIPSWRYRMSYKKGSLIFIFRECIELPSNCCSYTGAIVGHVNLQLIKYNKCFLIHQYSTVDQCPQMITL